MNDQNQSFEIKTKKQVSNINLLLSWAFGIFFILCGIGLIFTSIVSGIIFIVGGLILLPTIAEKIEKTYKVSFSRNMKVSIVFLVIILSAVLSSITDKKDDSPSLSKVQEVKTETINNQNSISKESAQKDLDEIISLGKKAGLIVSYEFSDKATVVYIGSTWYTQTVAFKKDFMAKIASLKKVITGYNHFEARDAYSNEKVAEVTAFSNSIEVYK